MFKRYPESLSLILQKLLRDEGLELPLKQSRLIDAWEKVAGKIAARYTTQKFIKNQTLFVKITNPALRQDLTMMRSQLVAKLNREAGGAVIMDIHFF